MEGWRKELITSLLTLGLISSCAMCWIASCANGGTATTDENNQLYATSTAVAQVAATSDAQVAATSTAVAQVAATSTAVAQQFLSEYLNIPNLNDPGEPYSPYIVGKVILIDRINVKLYTLNNLPEGLLAATPKEVGTVIWVDCLRYEQGPYSNGGFATWFSCDVTIIDKAKATIVGRPHFDGQYPPPAIDCSQVVVCGCCSPPDDDMAKYIASLPRK
jgi:hypothetical protein